MMEFAGWPDAPVTTTAGEPTGAEPLSDSGTDPAAHDPRHLLLHDAGRLWDLGPAMVDTDDDGLADTLTRTDGDGVVVYTDADQDGEVDTITEIGADGSYWSRSLDEQSRQWLPTDSGRLG